MGEPKSDLEQEFITRYIQVNGVTRDWFDSRWEMQVKGIPGRNFTFDFAHRAVALFVEIEGGTWMAKGGHNTAKGIERDCIKSNLAQANDFMVIRLTGDMVRDPKWIEFVHALVTTADERYPEAPTA